MRKHFFLIFVVLTIGGIAQQTYVPDDNFEQALIDLGYDSGTLDDFVPTSNIASVISLNIPRKGITDLTGIEDFLALRVLNASGNSFTSADITKNTALIEVNFNSNFGLTALDVTKNLALKRLYVVSTVITSLDVTKNLELEELSTIQSRITALDVSQNTKLTTLACSGISLEVTNNTLLKRFLMFGSSQTTIDLSNNLNLEEIDFRTSRLNSLDLSNNTALRIVNVRANSLTDIDLSSLTQLVTLDVGNNQLTSLNLQNGNNATITSVDISGNANLTCVQVDAGFVPSISAWTKDDTTFYSENCTATNIFQEIVDTDWSNAGNWNLSRLPVATDNVIIAEGKKAVLDDKKQETVLRNLRIRSGASLTVVEGEKLTITRDVISEGVFELLGSMIIEGNATGDATFQRSLPTTDWYLIGSPVIFESFENFIANHNLATGTGGNLGLGTYITSAANIWEYQNASSTGFMFLGRGYGVKLATPGTISLTGKINNNTTTQLIFKGTRNDFNLAGNPFFASINSSTFITKNTSVLQEQTIWVWNGSRYVSHNAMNPIDITPGMGYFIEAKTDRASIRFDKNDRRHTIVSRENPVSKIKLLIDNGDQQTATELYYVANKNVGFDNGYDSSLFGGVASDFDVYTALINDEKGKKLAIQTLPTTDKEQFSVPVGVHLEKDQEITFTAEMMNFPEGTMVYLEDKQANSFVNLSEKEYKIQLTKTEKETGRFYVHISSKRLNNEDSITEEVDKVQIYTTGKEEVVIKGLETTAEVDLFTLDGKVIVHQELKKAVIHKVSIPKISSGVYIVQVKGALGVITKKILLQ
ncbi:T9SS type A sorting domain-containing protein [Tenacibaculum agarivorans]|uniref:T9SS type A sorting domain-containing protein n=1 Tax=Tenacibaculum agarivorans TaxID=1908389 RepID=UPI00094B9124|nr:T9SS type A sorting domain-containing protein [Tenacibaculum agarivorans]